MMTNFPDTIFRVAGYLPLDQYTSGSAIVVFQSLEHEAAYFTQEVYQDKISGFSPIDHDFERIQEDISNEIVKIGSEPIWCFISAKEVVISSKDILIEKLRELIRSGCLDREPQLEAAFIIGDNELVDKLLDQTYFMFSKEDRSSSDFFKLNNILRDRVIDQLNDDNLKAIMMNSKLKLEGDGIQVSFPAIANRDQRHALTALIYERIRTSKAFGFKEKQSVAFSTSIIDELLQRIKLDLPYSKRFLEWNGHREIFFPVGVAKLRGLNSFSNREIGRIAREYLLDNAKGELGPLVEATMGGMQCFDLQSAREIAVALMFASQRMGEVDVNEFGKIRCCTFQTRSLWYLASDYMHGKEPAVAEELLCIDLVRRKFRDAEFIVDISFGDYFSFSERGVLSEKNYETDLEFGLSDGFLAALIARNLDFDLKIMAKVD